MTQHPHPLRCETCKHHKLVGRIPDIDECDILDHTPTESEKKLIRQIGCASHSNATTTSAGQVLDELERRVIEARQNNQIGRKNRNLAWGTMLEWIAELRQQAKERG